jgi:YgiT-type zinc finger domain-containing protein
MKCVMCKYEEVRDGSSTVTLERGSLTLVIKNVPSRVCPNCGEAYIDEGTTRKLLATAEAEVQAGAQVEVRQYKAA